jgi:hypothetical protein
MQFDGFEFRRRRAIINARLTPWRFEVLDEAGQRIAAFDIRRSDGNALQAATEPVVTHIDLRPR